jgi:hypothetical protein
MLTSPSDAALVGGSDAATATYQRERLAGEIAVSFHEVVPWRCLAMAVKNILWALLTLLLAAIFLAATAAMVKKNLVPSAVFGGSVTIMSFLLGLWQISKAIQTYTDRLSDVAICPSGLRWHKGEQQALALWSEIAGVDVAWHMPQRTMTGLAGAAQAWSARPTLNSVTIKTHSGETLVLHAATLTDIVGFAKTVKDCHALSKQESNPTKWLRGDFLPK